MFPGDFIQTLNVIVRGTRAGIVKACSKYSPFSKPVECLKVCTNIRAHLRGESTNFTKHLILIGDRKVPDSYGRITIDKEQDNIITNIEDLMSSSISGCSPC